jgi:hypothetical protein
VHGEAATDEELDPGVVEPAQGAVVCRALLAVDGCRE